MTYRPEIDGLRAISIIPVIFYHAGFDLFSGGFLGVDIFFVLSGYLITTILINDLDNKKFSLLYFYERRIRRIIPALFFVTFVSIPFAWMWLLPVQMEDFASSVASVGLFSSNILFWKTTGYFGTSSELVPLLHTWSLAVEEQYYILFPIFLLLTWRYGKNKIFWIIITLMVISLLLSEWAWRNGKERANFYLLPTRAWEIFAGSICAFLLNQYKIKTNNFLSFAGLLIIIFSIFLFDKETPFPSIYALMPILGTLLIILYAGSISIVAKILSLKILVGIGLISYSAYLWHHPIFAFAKIRYFENSPGILFMIALCSLTIILAFFSWKYVEKPFRDKSKINKKNVFILFYLFFLILFSFGILGKNTDGFKNRFDDKLLKNLDQALEKIKTHEDCNLDGSYKPKHPIKNCKDFFINNSSKVLIIGDSHAFSISHELQKQLYKKKIGSYFVSHAGCIPIAGLYRVNKISSNICNQYNKNLINYAKANNIKTIILIARFSLYINGNRYNNNEGGVEKGSPIFFDVISNKKIISYVNDKKRIKRVSDHITKEIKKLNKHFNLIIFKPIPEVGWDVPSHLSYLKIYKNKKNNEISHSYKSYLYRVKNFNNIIKNLKDTDVYFYDSSNPFCNKEIDRCFVSNENGIFYRDDDHLSNLGSKRIIDDFMKKFPKHLYDKE